MPAPLAVSLPETAGLPAPLSVSLPETGLFVVGGRGVVDRPAPPAGSATSCSPAPWCSPREQARTSAIEPWVEPQWPQAIRRAT